MTPSDGRVVGTTKIVDHGPAAQRWNVAIMGDGYQPAQLPQFAADAQLVADALLTIEPFAYLAAGINVFRIDVESTDEGADDACAQPPVTRRTYFDARFCAGGVPRLLVANEATALNVAAAQVPQFHVALVIVNSETYGGSGGQVPVISRAPGAAEIALHELGHSAFGLADEYEFYYGCGHDAPGTRDRHPAGEPPEPNVTTNADPRTIKWRDLLTPGIPVPTTRNANCAVCDPQPSPVAPEAVGAFEGARYYHCGAFRPQFDCRMRKLGFPFCAVCRRVIERTLAPFVPPDLCYIKTAKTADRTVELHFASASSDYRRRPLEVPSDFHTADGPNGTWQVGPPRVNGWPTLYFIKTANTPGTVEVHWSVFDPATARYRRARDHTTLYGVADGVNGTWQMYSAAGRTAPDLFFIKTQATPSGLVEVHGASAASAFQTRIIDVVSDFVAGPADGTWQLGMPNVNGWPTLYFIKTRNAPRTVEVHWSVYDPARQAYRRAGDLETCFPLAVGPLGTWQMRVGGAGPHPLLYFIQHRATATGRVEVEAASAASAYGARLFELVSDFGVEQNGVWQMTTEH